MDRKSAFVRFISNDYSIDYWSDVAIEEAIELANAFSQIDWVSLRSESGNLPPNVQARIAQIAGGVSTYDSEIGEMLIAMLSSGDADVVESSLDSLNSISHRWPNRLNRIQLEQALDNITPGDKLSACILDSLKHQLKS